MLVYLSHVWSYSGEWNVFLDKIGTLIPQKLWETDGLLSLAIEQVSESHGYFSVLKSDMVFQQLFTIP